MSKTERKTKVMAITCLTLIFSFKIILPIMAPVTGDVAVIGVTKWLPISFTAVMKDKIPVTDREPPTNPIYIRVVLSKLRLLVIANSIAEFIKSLRNARFTGERYLVR